MAMSMRKRPPTRKQDGVGPPAQRPNSSRAEGDGWGVRKCSPDDKTRVWMIRLATRARIEFTAKC